MKIIFDNINAVDNNDTKFFLNTMQYTTEHGHHFSNVIAVYHNIT